MTPHISAKKEEIGSIVLMPGDPLRAKKIAETFLEDYKLVNETRNMYIYTGFYKGNKITIAGSGMGCPSIGIYSYELFKFYDVDYIIRVGSAGSYNEKINVYDIYNVKDAFGENNYAKLAANIDETIIPASKEVFEKINDVAERLKYNIFTGTAHSSDVFYRLGDSLEFANKNNLDVVEMESFALFANAIVTNKKAGCLLTVSDSFITNQITTSEERQNNFMKMCELALESSIELLNN
ncbi:purine-nucleoside phosphorylase [Spiroplasma turonicum]|uniref:Uridine phosphorylase n=1 Tax=Spiroplasma turonicum TaxID=216946 RepID=A0A0K1P4V4_9MOLU|nr:purine-nucleoside phosphorylase [Spiroplasma turonicum]AKU79326.1 purine nucleoside phosphorylase [Spiroplasma turonicum]ALX70347.1 purine-nucleoside phosphorylase [Spiroplasma turonicum]